MYGSLPRVALKVNKNKFVSPAAKPWLFHAQVTQQHHHGSVGST